MYIIKNWHMRTNPGNPKYNEATHLDTCVHCKCQQVEVLESKFDMPVTPLPTEQTRTGLSPITEDMPDPRTVETVIYQGTYCKPCHDMMREFEAEYRMTCIKYDYADRGEFVCL